MTFNNILITTQTVTPGVVTLDLTWASDVLALLGIISIIATGVAFWVRYEVKKNFNEIKNELKPNGGGSLKDQVTRLEQGHKDLEKRFDRIDEKVDTIVNFILKADDE